MPSEKDSKQESLDSGVSKRALAHDYIVWDEHKHPRDAAGRFRSQPLAFAAVKINGLIYYGGSHYEAMDDARRRGVHVGADHLKHEIGWLNGRGEWVPDDSPDVKRVFGDNEVGSEALHAMDHKWGHRYDKEVMADSMRGTEYQWARSVRRRVDIHNQKRMGHIVKAETFDGVLKSKAVSFDSTLHRRMKEDKQHSDPEGYALYRDLLADGQVHKAYDENEHPRYPAGSPQGGQFRPNGGVGVASKYGLPVDKDNGYELLRTKGGVEFAYHMGLQDTDLHTYRLFRLTPKALAAKYATWAHQAGLKNIEVSVDGYGADMSTVRLHIESRDGSGNKTMEMERAFAVTSKGERVAEHNSFFLTDSLQGKGVAKHLLYKSFRFYRSHGFNRVEVGTTSVGSYAWAKFGFVPDRLSWNPEVKEGAYQRIRRAIQVDAFNEEKSQLLSLLDKDPHSIWRLADHPSGRNVLRGFGTSWYGSFNLNDREAVTRFLHYVRKGRAA